MTPLCHGVFLHEEVLRAACCEDESLGDSRGLGIYPLSGATNKRQAWESFPAFCPARCLTPP